MKANIKSALKMVFQFILDNLPEKEDIPLMIIGVICFIGWGYWGFPKAKLMIIAIISAHIAICLIFFICHILGALVQAKLFVELYPVLNAIDDGKLDPETIDDLDEDELEKILSHRKPFSLQNDEMKNREIKRKPEFV